MYKIVSASISSVFAGSCFAVSPNGGRMIVSVLVGPSFIGGSACIVAPSRTKSASNRTFYGFYNQLVFSCFEGDACTDQGPKDEVTREAVSERERMEILDYVAYGRTS